MVGDGRFVAGDDRFGVGEGRFGDGESRFAVGGRRFGEGESRFGDGGSRLGISLILERGAEGAMVIFIARQGQYMLLYFWVLA